MYVGHALLGFAVGAALARRWGLSRDRALAVAVTAAAFAIVPDLDAVYTIVAVARTAVTRGTLDVFPTTKYVWPHSWVVHRSVTHSLLTGATAAAVAVGVARSRGPGGDGWRRSWGLPVAVTGAAGLVGVATLTLGVLAGVVAATFVTAAAVIALVARHHFLSVREVALAATVGLLTHPLGDLFMGRPPALFYPLDGPELLVPLRVTTDPTLTLLSLFALELALAWWALATYGALRGRTLRRAYAPEAAVGAAYALVTPVVAPPTLDLAYGWAAGLLVVGVVPALRRWEWPRPDLFEVTVTGLGGLTYALAGYLVAYLWLF